MHLRPLSKNWIKSLVCCISFEAAPIVLTVPNWSEEAFPVVTSIFSPLVEMLKLSYVFYLLLPTYLLLCGCQSPHQLLLPSKTGGKRVKEEWLFFWTPIGSSWRQWVNVQLLVFQSKHRIVPTILPNQKSSRSRKVMFLLACSRFTRQSSHLGPHGFNICRILVVDWTPVFLELQRYLFLLVFRDLLTLGFNQFVWKFVFFCFPETSGSSPQKYNSSKIYLVLVQTSEGCRSA